MGLDPGMKSSCLNATLLLFFAALAAGCAITPKENDSTALSNKDTKSAESNQEVTPPDEDPCSIDPYEKFNRRFYKVTETIDQNVLGPVADSYIDYIPDSVRTSVGNFYDNLAYPNVILNGLLQGKLGQGMGDGLRFLVNTTVGVAGLFDPATPLGLLKHDEDFGQTLGVWGVDSTSYMYLPILGPSSNRDVYSIPVTIASNVLFYAGFFLAAPITIPLGVLAVVDKRARYAESIRLRDQAALDPYLFTREAYWQQRENLVFDGKPPVETYDNLFINDDDNLYDTSETSSSNEPCPEEPV
jgi:phospholipid-binding lipoprotein MlaA